MFREDKSTSNRMFAFSVRDFLTDDSDVHLYLDLFDSLDLDDFVMSFIFAYWIYWNFKWFAIHK